MKKQVLIVDDVEMNRDLLATMLEDSYGILTAENGQAAIDIMEAKSDKIAVVLLDLVMPQMDGFQVLQIFKEKSWFNLVPVIVITGETDTAKESMCLEMGAMDFIRKPFSAAIVRRRVNNAAELISYKNHLEDKVAKQTRSITRYANKLKTMNDDIINLLGSVVESRDVESGEHIFRVQGYTKIIAQEIMKRYPEYGLTQEKTQLIVSASALHDVGKIAIPDNILLKPGRYTPDEYAIMKSHSFKGYELIQKTAHMWDKDYVSVCSEIAYYHHERFDGRGYPCGLKGDEIPISAQIVSLADVYDALVNERCYKKAIPKDEAYRMIIEGECGTFSPKILDCFEKTKKKFEKMADKEM
ncbi:MAG: response regulator [Bacteroidaceae bacterium]|nr:response regulator [Bacteroidaceae bacterium]